ncbi:MAG: hypothetical protein FWG37_03755 [Clostridia bacterium]|nr:hypothetical protein [Clostridia bacterium]
METSEPAPLAPASVRFLLVIGDGIADRPLPCLNGKTPLQSLPLPGMARLASQRMGLVRTVPAGTAAGSDTAILSIFGCDPRLHRIGRAALEAAGLGIPLRDFETVWRVNLVTVTGDVFDAAVMRSHNGSGIHGKEALGIIQALRGDPAFRELSARLGFTLHESQTFRQMGVAPAKETWGDGLPGPHDHLGEPIGPLVPEGDIRALMLASFEALRGRQANCIWPWAAGRASALPGFESRYGHSGPVVSAVPLVKGIAVLCGLPAPDVPGATGELDTNYRGKVRAVLDGFAGGACFAAVHVEAPDECSHALDVGGKLEALRRLDARVIIPLMNALDADEAPYRVLFLSDHPTFVHNGAHDGAPVPFALYDSRKEINPRLFSEQTAAAGEHIDDGTRLMELLFDENDGS